MKFVLKKEDGDLESVISNSSPYLHDKWALLSGNFFIIPWTSSELILDLILHFF